MRERVLALGGTVEIATPGNDEARPMQSANALPKAFFQVRRISLKGVNKPLEPQLAETLACLRFAEFDQGKLVPRFVFP